MASSHYCPPQNTIRFFKIILESSLQRGKLQVPSKFVRKYGENMPNPVFLKPPDGTEWEINLTKYDNGEVWFEKGWREFATHYSLDYGHLVVFKYEKGTYSFEINIFDMSAIEIEYPSPLLLLHEQKQNTNDDDDNDNDSVEFLYETPKAPLSLSFGPLHQGKGKRLNKSINEIQVLNSTKQELQGDKMSRRNFCIENHPNKPNALLQGREKPLTPTEKAKALERVGTFMSKNPHFKIAMQPTYISQCLCVPASFVEQHLKGKKKEGSVVLEVSDGRKWYAKYKTWVSGSNLKLVITNGWNIFARDNDLKVGDVCIFVLLTNTVPFSFLVHIFAEYQYE